MIRDLTDSEVTALRVKLADPLIRKYLELIRANTVHDIAYAPPRPNLEEYFREVRFAQGVLRTVDEMLQIGGQAGEIKTE